MSAEALFVTDKKSESDVAVEVKIASKVVASVASAFSKDDLVKVDYGVHYNGCIIDSAFTFSLSNKYDELIEIGKSATELAIKNSGVDAILGEIGAETQEFIESHEVEIEGKVYPVKSIRDLTGHMIFPYIIHASKSVPNFKIYYPERMEENEFYAIETFPTTGNGKTTMDLECSHYMVNSDRILKEKTLPKFAKSLLSMDGAIRTGRLVLNFFDTCFVAIFLSV